LTLEYQAVTAAPTDPSFDVVVTNVGNGNVDLTRVTIQYYLTSDGATALVSLVNSATMTTPTQAPYFQSLMAFAQVTFAPFTPSTPTADTVLAIAFAPGAPALPPGGQVEVDLSYHSPNYDVSFNQSNDYSYDGASNQSPSPSKTITAKFGGVTVWGVAP
jgi:hypothetical protein